MRGDQLARQWRIVRAIEASPNGLTVAEIAQREETAIRAIYRDLDALHPPYHTKAQSAPSEVFGTLYPSFEVFSLSLLHLMGKQIRKNPLGICKRENQNGRIKKFDSFGNY